MYKLADRPEDLECKALWELYVLLNSLDEPYIRAKTGRNKEYLYHIEGISRPEGKERYTVFGCDDIADMEIYDGRDEWIDLVLVRMEDNRRIEEKYRVQFNTKYCLDFSVMTLMMLAHIFIPTYAELDAAEMKNGLPVTYRTKWR